MKVEAFLEVWKPWFEAEGLEGREVFERVAREYRAFNERLVNSAEEPALENYRVFWENRSLLERIGQRWAAELRKNAKLSRKMLEFLDSYQI